MKKLIRWFLAIPILHIGMVTAQTNNDPIAVEDSILAPLGSSVTIHISTLLSNDFDTDGDEIYITTVDDSENGLAMPNRDAGFITFTPNSADVTEGSFIYGITDIEGSNDYARMGFAKVTITFANIDASDDLPVATNDAFIATENIPLVISVSELFQNDYDPDGDPISLTLVDDWSGGELSFNVESGLITYLPEPGFVQGQFTYGIADNGDRGDYARMGFAFVFITREGGQNTPEDLPAIARNDTFELNSADPLTIPTASLLANDEDPEGEAVHLLFVRDAINGEVILDVESDTITFLPSDNFVEGGFSYGVSDNVGETDESRIGLGFATLRLNNSELPQPIQDEFATPNSTQRFLSRSTFGPTKGDLNALVGTSASEWFLQELSKPTTLLSPVVNEIRSLPTEGDLQAFRNDIAHRFAFLKNAIDGNDQLRQRMAFALSEILVISERDPFLEDRTRAIATFQDILINHAFGNYRDILEEVTYSPAMGAYLTYAGNRRGDPVTGRTPDENYAREIMQLFSIGVLELEQNGEPKVASDGNFIETYNNDDITGLARVFTGLYYATPNFGDPLLDTSIEVTAMTPFNAFHSSLEKHFLGTTIPENTPIEESIDIALDTLINHPNTAPFISRQLIQRIVTSHPTPNYVERVAVAFSSGQFRLPNGTTVGDGRRGDMSATLASILFDEDAQSELIGNETGFGKIREPLIRFTQWARAFEAQNVTPEYALYLWNLNRALGQQAYSAPSVFNFFRPGYIAPGTETGAANLNAPELQTTSSVSIPQYANFINFMITEQLRTSTNSNVSTVEQVRSTLSPDYSNEITLANNPLSLVNFLDTLLTGGRLSSSTKSNIVSALLNIPLAQTEGVTSGSLARVYTAIFMVMTSPNYLVQR